jgi:ribosomal protein S1
MVPGKVLKLASYGAFVELDPEIHGLAHLGELSTEKITDASAVLKEGEEREFRIISIEPADHRLGLSLRPPKAETKAEVTEPPKVEETPATETSQTPA